MSGVCGSPDMNMALLSEDINTEMADQKLDRVPLVRRRQRGCRPLWRRGVAL